MPQPLHLHLPPGFTGELTIGDVQVVVRASDGMDADLPASHHGKSAPANEAPEEEEPSKRDRILASFARHTPEVLDLHAAMVARGWDSIPPTERSKRMNESYLRMHYAGSQHSVSLYLNTLYLECSGRSARRFAATLPNAEVRPNRNVFLHFAGRPDASVDAAVQHVTAMERWADGERQ